MSIRGHSIIKKRGFSSFQELWNKINEIKPWAPKVYFTIDTDLATIGASPDELLSCLQVIKWHMENTAKMTSRQEVVNKDIS